MKAMVSPRRFMQIRVTAPGRLDGMERSVGPSPRRMRREQAPPGA